MKVICVCYIFCSSLINIIIFYSILDSVADGHCAGADGTWWLLWSTASSLVVLLVREYEYVGGFDAGDGDDGNCNKRFDGDETMLMATATVMAVRE